MPLTGIRILDLTRLLPGAFCTLLLADMGAEVIKVEEPSSGDYMRWMPPLIEGQSALFNALNRNKKSITLNLKSDAGRDLFLRLAASAGVLVEGNRPGVMDRLGVGWDAVHAVNPRLVMCSITGYGQSGPLAERAGHDLNYMAIAGGLGLNGPPDGPPVPLSVQVADIGGGGLQPAVAILAALVAVERGGQGRWIDASMTDGALAWMALPLAARGAGEAVRRGDQRLAGRYPCYRVYACRDGGHYSVGALEPKFWAELCAAIGRPELVDQQFSETRDAHHEMEEVFASRTRDEWQRALSGLDVCCEPVLDIDEVPSHPHVVARRMISSHASGVEVAPAIRMSDEWRRLDPPRLGQHTAEVLAEVGVDAGRYRQLKSEGVV